MEKVKRKGKNRVWVLISTEMIAQVVLINSGCKDPKTWRVYKLSISSSSAHKLAYFVNVMKNMCHEVPIQFLLWYRA